MLNTPALIPQLICIVLDEASLFELPPPETVPVIANDPPLVGVTLIGKLVLPPARILGVEFVQLIVTGPANGPEGVQTNPLPPPLLKVKPAGILILSVTEPEEVCVPTLLIFIVLSNGVPTTPVPGEVIVVVKATAGAGITGLVVVIGCELLLFCLLTGSLPPLTVAAGIVNFVPT